MAMPIDVGNQGLQFGLGMPTGFDAQLCDVDTGRLNWHEMQWS